MSHHIDTAEAEADGRLDLCDLYVFDGQDGQSTVLILTVNPFAGHQSPTTFHPQALYDFKIDLNGDAVEELAFRLSFGEPDAAGTQSIELRQAVGLAAQRGKEGKLLASGITGTNIPVENGGRLWAGLAADPFFGNGEGLERFHQALAAGFYDRTAFANAENAFHRQNITGIVFEAPSAIWQSATLRIWATTLLLHGSEQIQINREANPLMLHLFHRDEALKRAFNRGHPREDLSHSGPEVARLITLATRLAGSVESPEEYGNLTMRALLPDMMFYLPNTTAGYTVAKRNGRRLMDDGMDVQLSLMTNTTLSDGVNHEGSYRDCFPYLALPF